MQIKKNKIYKIVFLALCLFAVTILGSQTRASADATVCVTSNSPYYSYFVHGPDMTWGASGQGQTCWSGHETGSYWVEPEDAPGNTESAGGAGSVGSGGTIEMTVSWTQVYAQITVTSNLSTNWTLVGTTGGGNYNGSGTYENYTVPCGQYHVNADDIDGYTKSISPGETSFGC